MYLYKKKEESLTNIKILIAQQALDLAFLK
jgi:hypothetical protein